LWFRNTWSWASEPKPKISAEKGRTGALSASSNDIGLFSLYYEGSPELLFTENETNHRRLHNASNASPYVKDAFHEYIVGGNKAAINPALEGTKAALHYNFEIPAGKQATVKLRLAQASKANPPTEALGSSFSEPLANRVVKATEFSNTVIPANADDDTRKVMRQAFAGLMWTKQFYPRIARKWVEGDPAMPKPP